MPTLLILNSLINFSLPTTQEREIDSNLLCTAGGSPTSAAKLL